MSDNIKIEKSQLEEIAAEAAKKAVQDTFAKFGIDINSVEEIRHFQANMGFIFRFRKLSEKVGATIILTIATICTGGILALFWDTIMGKNNGH